MFATELARNTAAAGWHVLLLECDFGCPSLSRYFGLRPGPGLCEILSGRLLGEAESVMHQPAPRPERDRGGPDQGRFAGAAGLQAHERIG